MVVCYTQLANIIIFMIDLAQGIITIVHFDEERHELWGLFLFWFFWILAYALFASVCLHGERKCYWDDCLVLCAFEVGQCCLFIDFCRDETHLTWLLILLASNQIMLKIFWTLTQCCQGWQEERTPGAAHRVVPTPHHPPGRGQQMVFEDGLDEVYASFGLSVEKGGIRQTIFGKAFSEAFPALWACLLCLCQPESPFRNPGYEVYLCVFVWIQSFMRKLKRAQRKDKRAAGFDWMVVYIHVICASGFSIWTSILYWIWGLSPELYKTYDRVITILGIIMTCLGLLYTLSIPCCLLCHGGKK